MLNRPDGDRLLFLRFFAVAIVGAAFLFFARRAKASTVTATAADKKGFRALYEKWGDRYGVDPDLLQALAQVESSEDANAVRYVARENKAGNWSAVDASVGLMQILYLPSDPDNADSPPRNSFNIEGWAGTRFSDLFNPDLNVMLGAQIIAWNLKTFGFPRGVAVYNSWEARNDAPQGPFQNQAYVEKVLSRLSNLKGT